MTASDRKQRGISKRDTFLKADQPLKQLEKIQLERRAEQSGLCSQLLFISLSTEEKNTEATEGGGAVFNVRLIKSHE